MLYEWRRSASRRGTIALWMLLGIWMQGPFCMMAAVSTKGGGFSLPGTAQWLLRNFWMFPMTTFIMSTYTLMLGALVFITIWFLVIAGKSFSHRTDEGAAEG